MEHGKRGLPLTLFAIAFGLLAIADLTKPLSKTPGVGLVFFGAKLTGTADLIIAPLFGAFLAIYAIGIWRMKRYALPMSHAYATYVFLNLLLFDMKHHDYKDAEGLLLMVGYAAVALGVSIASAILLTRRRDELS